MDYNSGIVLLCPVGREGHRVGGRPMLQNSLGADTCALMYTVPGNSVELLPWGIGSAEVPPEIIARVFDETEAVEVFVVPISYGQRVVVAARRLILDMGSQSELNNTEESSDASEKAERNVGDGQCPTNGPKPTQNSPEAANSNGSGADSGEGCATKSIETGEPTGHTYNGAGVVSGETSEGNGANSTGRTVEILGRIADKVDRVQSPKPKVGKA